MLVLQAETHPAPHTGDALRLCRGEGGCEPFPRWRKRFAAPKAGCAKGRLTSISGRMRGAAAAT